MSVLKRGRGQPGVWTTCFGIGHVPRINYVRNVAKTTKVTADVYNAGFKLGAPAFARCSGLGRSRQSTQRATKGFSAQIGPPFRYLIRRTPPMSLRVAYRRVLGLIA